MAPLVPRPSPLVPRRSAATDTVYLDRTDEVSSIHDKLEGARGDAIIVVAPRSVRLLRSPLYLKLLRRSAEQCGKQIALVAEDWLVRDLARQEGIPVYRSVRSVNGTAFGPRIPPQAGAAVRPLPRRDVPPGRLHYRGRWAWAVRVGALVSLLLIGLLGLLMYPTTTIAITPDTQDLAEDITIVASTRVRAISFGQYQVPARRIETQLERVDRAPATGKKTRGDQPATGQVILTNSTNAPINLSKGFQVQTADGKKFALQTDLVVPAGARGTQPAPVQAIEPGAAFNQPSFAIIRPADAAFAGRISVANPEPTRGGTDIEVPVITPEDVARLRARLVDRARQDAFAQLMALRVRDEQIYAEAVDYTIVEETLDKQPGEEGKEVGLRIAVKAAALAFSGNDVNVLALRRLEQDVKPGFQLVAGTMKSLPPGLLAFDQDSVTFLLSTAAKATPRLDETRLKRELANRSREDARAYLTETLQLSQPPEITNSPDWIGNVSLFFWRINLVVVPRP